MPEHQERTFLSRYLLRQISADRGSVLKLLVYSILFAGILALQMLLPIPNADKGVLAQLQVLLSVAVVVVAPRTGIKAAVAMNLGETLVIGGLVVSGRMPAAGAGIVVPVFTMLVLCVVAIYQGQLLRQLQAQERQRAELARLNGELLHSKAELERQNRQLTEANGQLQRSEQQLHYLTFYDVATTLPNRDLILKQVDLMINLAAMTPISFPLLYIDLDRFAQIGERVGPRVSDRLFGMVAARLMDNLHKEDMLGRYGNDSFLLVVQRNQTREEAERYAELLRTCLHAPFHVEGVRYDLRCSIGAAFHPEDAMSTTALLRCAEIALRCAKDGGRDAVRFHTHGAGAHASA